LRVTTDDWGEGGGGGVSAQVRLSGGTKGEGNGGRKVHFRKEKGI